MRIQTNAFVNSDGRVVRVWEHETVSDAVERVEHVLLMDSAHVHKLDADRHGRFELSWPPRTLRLWPPPSPTSSTSSPVPAA